MPNILDRQFNPSRDMSMNDSNLARHGYFHSKRLNGTCGLLFNSEEWLLATQGSYKMLFCWGDPGVGKSFLT